jgi:uncharacterized protein
MEIPLHNLPKAGRRFIEQWSTIGVTEDSGVRGLRAVEADVVATGDAQRLHVTGQVSATVELICSRCLKEFAQPTRTALALTYALTPETLDEDLDVERLVEGRVVDPQPEIIGAILSDLPFQTVCSEGCRGLCPQCGADLNLGPCGCPTDTGSPFAVLKNLQRPPTGGGE